DPEPFAVAGGDLASVRVDDQGRDQDQEGDDEADQGAPGNGAALDLLAQPERGPGVGAGLEQLARQSRSAWCGHQGPLPGGAGALIARARACDEPHPRSAAAASSRVSKTRRECSSPVTSSTRRTCSFWQQRTSPPLPPLPAAASIRCQARTIRAIPVESMNWQ